MPRGQPISLDAISEHESFRDGSRSNFLTTAVGNTIVERGHTVASLRRIVLRNCLLSRTAKRPARARAVWRFLVATSRHILAMYPIRIHLRSALRVSFVGSPSPSLCFLFILFLPSSFLLFFHLLPHKLGSRTYSTRGTAKYRPPGATHARRKQSRPMPGPRAPVSLGRM